MEYRKLPRGEISLSTLGLGGEYLDGLTQKEVDAIFDCAIANGINVLDLFMAQPDIRDAVGMALRGRRDKMYIQGHLGSVWKDGQYTRSRDLDESKAGLDDLLRRLRTDYIDFLMLHYVDKEEDYQALLASGMLEHARALKERGVAQHLGFSSHDPVVSRKLIETGLFDMLMFSINPAYDLDPTDDINALFEMKPDVADGAGIDPNRSALYELCQREGIGITVMKALGGGNLLRAETSPFGERLTVAQCMHYCLTRPAVLSCLIGVKSAQELKEAMKYFTAKPAELDFSAIAKSPKYSMTGKCVYCNHCLPCPVKIDIGQVNKYLDLALIGGTPDSVREHYRALRATADQCTACGKCEPNCPFGVNIRDRMEQAKKVFA